MVNLMFDYAAFLAECDEYLFFLTEYKYRILFCFQISPNTEYIILNIECHSVLRKSEYRIPNIIRYQENPNTDDE